MSNGDVLGVQTRRPVPWLPLELREAADRSQFYVLGVQENRPQCGVPSSYSRNPTAPFYITARSRGSPGVLSALLLRLLGRFPSDTLAVFAFPSKSVLPAT
jgi:hypothetical protein